ncbi:MAG: carboxypeptidase-like regulatory domain-containing protein [Bacteroidota bacterium]
MSKRFQLSIDVPCHENWDNMSASEQGRFCGSCQKQVMDFTSMSDAQVAAFFKKPSTGSVCGRFYDDQLNRDMRPPKKSIPWARYFFQFALPTFLMSAKAAAQGNAAVKKTAIAVTPSVRMKLGEVSVPNKKIEIADKINISGKVIDENNDPVPYASIMIKGSKLGVSADSSGVFKLETTLITGEVILSISSVGFEAKEMTLVPGTYLLQEITVQLKQKLMNEVVVTGYSTIKGRVIVGAISKITERTISDISIPEPPAEKPAMIKVYPNPVLSGTSINIGCERLEEGYYIFRLFSQAGQEIQQKKVWIDAEATIMNMEIPAVAAGSYVLTLINKESGKRFSEKIIIQR